MLFVEGGGDRNPSLASECRKAFSELFKKAGVKRKPRVVACGGRALAYKQFRDAQETGGSQAWLLVDAEELPDGGTSKSPWNHVKARAGDQWERPAQANDDQLHFMAVCMETWLVADVGAMRKVFGPKLDDSKLTAPGPLENVSKSTIYSAIEAATNPTKAGKYGKGPHSFRVLQEVSPEAIRTLSWGKRFLDEMLK
jgi:hypothetical protein